jgi:hypothetical protein
MLDHHFMLTRVHRVNALRDLVLGLSRSGALSDVLSPRVSSHLHSEGAWMLYTFLNAVKSCPISQKN